MATLHAFAIDNHCFCNKGPGCEEFGEYEVGQIDCAGISEAWYVYRSGDYCGCGDMIARKSNGRWMCVSLGHCSCYGPTDGLDREEEYDSLDALIAKLSPDYGSSLSELIAKVRA